MTKNLTDYYKPVEVIRLNKQITSLDSCAYCIDGHPRGGDYDMAKHVGLSTCHCCDYFIFEEKVFSLIETTTKLKTKKEDMKRYNKKDNNTTGMERCYAYIPNEKEQSEFFKELIIQEHVNKVYGSMLVLFLLARKCPIMERNLYKREKFKFWLVISTHNAPEFEPKNIKILESITKGLNNRLKGIWSRCVECVESIECVEVDIFGIKKLEKNIKNNAVEVS